MKADLCTSKPLYPWPCTTADIQEVKFLYVCEFGSVNIKTFESNMARFHAIQKAGKRGKRRPGHLYPVE